MKKGKKTIFNNVEYVGPEELLGSDDINQIIHSTSELMSIFNAEDDIKIQEFINNIIDEFFNHFYDFYYDKFPKLMENNEFSQILLDLIEPYLFTISDVKTMFMVDIENKNPEGDYLEESIIKAHIHSAYLEVSKDTNSEPESYRPYYYIIRISINDIETTYAKSILTK